MLRLINLLIGLLLSLNLKSFAYDPNTFVIKHQSGKSKAILDKKFVHIQMPAANTGNPLTETDSSALMQLSVKPEPIVAQQKPVNGLLRSPNGSLAMTKGSNKSLAMTKGNGLLRSARNDDATNNNWNDYAEADNSNTNQEATEELNVNAKLIN